ncbi:MAG: methyl-accepting chemotaxis protein [Gammaproteobacteria bacterium]|nr:methyl-accepting chemotaxis protein [Gammaproteobacteria bacterium]
MAEKKGARTAGTRRQFTLLALAVAFMGLTIGGFVFQQRIGARNQTWVTVIRQSASDVTALSAVGRDATKGVEPDFGTLDALALSFDETVRALQDGDAETGIEAVPPDLQDELASVTDAWFKGMRTAINAVLQNEEAYSNTASNIALIVDAANALLEQSPDPARLVALERLKVTATQVLASGRDAEITAGQLQQILATLGPAGAEAETLAGAVAAIVKDAPAVAQLQQNAATLQGEALNVIATAKNLEQALIDYATRYNVLPALVVTAGGLAVLALIGFIALFLALARQQLREAEAKDARQQQAILELLDEITNLADGDLTVDVTVTEDFTGAIADSINYTVANMRNLVGTITETSVEIANAASNTAETARKMNAASERQAKEVTTVTTAIVQSSQQLQQVASRAEQLAQEAQRSVQVAHSGAETVGRTIQGMASLREQIQDTSKRIKRLGESSQEIGNIIEFINDIAEQTNTLALNASIQAAMAGEAGRGFAVVADEVQRLAERAANATRQIESLVKTIQADTSEAIVSMERSTANVVTGAKAAEEAGQALTQIESSSQELAKLITEISASARAQSAQANKIAGTMQVIRDIAVQTSGSAAQTAQKVGELTTLSEKLRSSVSGFKLPEGAAAA